MKKFLVLMSALLVVFAFVACSDDDSSGGTPAASSNSNASSSKASSTSTASSSSVASSSSAATSVAPEAVTIADLRDALSARMTEATDTLDANNSTGITFTTPVTFSATVIGKRTSANTTVYVQDAANRMFGLYLTAASSLVSGDVVDVVCSKIVNYYGLYETSGSATTATKTSSGSAVVSTTITSLDASDWASNTQFGKFMYIDSLQLTNSIAKSVVGFAASGVRIRNQTTDKTFTAGTYSAYGYLGRRDDTWTFFIDDIGWITAK